MTLQLDTRQRAMLEAMHIRVWLPGHRRQRMLLFQELNAPVKRSQKACWRQKNRL